MIGPDGGPDAPLSDPNLERQLLGMLMLLSETHAQDEIKQALAIVRPRDFFRTDHRLVFAAILALNKQRLHFGVEQVYSLLDRKGKLNGSLTHWDLEQMASEGSRVLPLVPAEQAIQLRAMSEYREVLMALRQMAEFSARTTDPVRLRARLRELSVGLEREALLHDVQTESFRALVEADFPALQPVVEPLLYAGDCMLIVGNAKAGKSVFMLQLAMAIASGGLALGALPVERTRPVLYLNLDDSRRRANYRAKHMLAAYEGVYPESLEFAHRWPPIDRGGEGMLITWAERHPEGVIFVDLLEKIRPSRSGSLYESDYAALNPLADIAHTHGVAVLIAHHTNKQGQGAGQEFDPNNALSGTMAIGGAVDGWLTIHPPNGDQPNQRRITLRNRDSEQTQFQVSWDELLSGWAWEGESLQRKIKKTMSAQRDAILTTIQQAARPLGPAEIADRLGRPSGAVRYLLHQMVRDEQIVWLSDQGKYEHPAEEARKGPAQT